jgi:hypothetical protein
LWSNRPSGKLLAGVQPKCNFHQFNHQGLSICKKHRQYQPICNSFSKILWWSIWRVEGHALHHSQ